MTDLTGKFQGLETQLATEHGETIDALNRIHGDGDGGIVDLLNALNLNTSTLVDIRTLLDQVLSTLDTLNNNASQNAKQAQDIALGSFNSCCVDPAPGTGEPDDMCQKSQELIALVAARLAALGANTPAGQLPTVDAIYDMFTVVADDGRTYPLLPRADCGMLLAALAQLGAGALDQLATLIEDEAIRTAVLNLLGTSNSAEQSSTRIRTLDPNGYTTPPGAARVFFYAFTVSLINTLWKDPPIWSGEGYEDICHSTPPPDDPFGFGGSSGSLRFIGSDDFYSHDTLDLSTWSEAIFRPLPSNSVGMTLYVRNCHNNTDNDDRNLYLATSDTDSGSVFLTLPEGATVPWVIPNDDPWVYVWGYGLAPDNPGHSWQVLIAWDDALLIEHCTGPEA